jgi:ACS family tartrate transporter-like MFS transporter
LVPLLFVCYIIAYVDRTNVAVAKLTMGEDLPQFDSWVFGFGGGIFFLGYFLLEVPGSVIVERWSARKWICRIMITWGIMAALTAFVGHPLGVSQSITDGWNAWRLGAVIQTPEGQALSGLAVAWNGFFGNELSVAAFQFYVVRFLLGVAEAGFFPGVLVYLTHWFPARDRARAISYFLVASPIAMIIGPAISRLFLDVGRTVVQDGVTITHPDLLGLKGWQWIYIFWGIPAVIAGLVVLFYLTDKPRQAKWLTPEESEALESELEKERSLHGAVHNHSLLAGLSNPRVWLLSLAYFGIVTANYGIEFFLPSILKDWYDLAPSRVALLSMIPSLLVIPGQLIVGWTSDHFRERRWHSVLPVAIGAILLVMAARTQGSLVVSMICFSIAAAGMKSYMPAFWSLPSLFLTASAAAGSVGLINSIGNLGGFLGPSVMGAVQKQFGSYEYGLYFLAFTSIASAVLIAILPLRDPAVETKDESRAD